MGRPIKYKTEAEKRKAAAESRRKYKAKKRAEKRAGKVASNPLQSAANVLARAVSESSTTPPPGQQQPGSLSNETVEDALPAVNIPTAETGSADATPSPEPSSPDAPSADAPNADSATDAPSSSSEASSESSAEKTEKADQINGEQLAQICAQMWVEALKFGSAYSSAHGFMGLGEPFLTMNHQSMLIIARKALAETSMNPEEFAAFVCVGSGGWVGWNSYRAYLSTKPKTNEGPKGDVINAESATVRTSPANGATNGATNGAPVPAQPAPPAPAADFKPGSRGYV